MYNVFVLGFALSVFTNFFSTYSYSYFLEFINYFCKKSPSEMFDWVLHTRQNLNLTLKNLKIVFLHLQKYRLYKSLVVCTKIQKRIHPNSP